MKIDFFSHNFFENGIFSLCPPTKNSLLPGDNGALYTFYVRHHHTLLGPQNLMLMRMPCEPFFFFAFYANRTVLKSSYSKHSVRLSKLP